MYSRNAETLWWDEKTTKKYIKQQLTKIQIFFAKTMVKSTHKLAHMTSCESHIGNFMFFTFFKPAKAVKKGLVLRLQLWDAAEKV